jgi:transcriptional regulator with XRE-family HTH domain
MINAGQCRMARAALRISVRDLAAIARVGVNTVVRFEGGEKLQDRTIDAIRMALEKAGIEFNADGRGVRLKPGRPRGRRK